MLVPYTLTTCRTCSATHRFTRDDGHAAQGGGKRPRFESGPGARTYDSGAGAVALGGSAIPGDNPPCSTLFIGNLADAVREEELTELFQAQPGEIRSLQFPFAIRITHIHRHGTATQSRALAGGLGVG